MNRATFAAIFSVLAILWACYIIYLGITNPDSVNYTIMLIGIGLFSVASYLVTMGAFKDIDEENGK